MALTKEALTRHTNKTKKYLRQIIVNLYLFRALRMKQPFRASKYKKKLRKLFSKIHNLKYHTTTDLRTIAHLERMIRIK